MLGKSVDWKHLPFDSLAIEKNDSSAGIHRAINSSRTSTNEGLAIKAAKSYLPNAHLFSSVMGKAKSMVSTSAAGSITGHGQTVSRDDQSKEGKEHFTLNDFL